MLSDLLVQFNPDGSLVYVNPYIDGQLLMGRMPFNYVEIDLDFCANTFGIAPCTATGTGDAKCYNTFASCQDTANFTNTVKTYRFCSPNGGRVPVGLDAIPCLKSITLNPAQIDAGKGLGMRATCEIRLQDFPHDDIRIDPYVNDRTYIPINQGTYFGKLKARNPFYNGRAIRIYSGYLNDDGSFSYAKFERRSFVIEGWDGIDPTGITKIVGKDVLKLASDDRAVCPKPSVGKLNLDMTAIATSFTATPSGVGADYPSSGLVRIGGEVMTFTRSGDVFTVVRGQRNTLATTHKALDTVQLCKEYAGQTAQNIAYDLLVNFANVDAAYITKSDWDTEQLAYLPRLYNTLLTTPTGVSKLLTELTEQIGFFLFWDEVAEKIRFQTIRPNSPSETVTALNNNEHLLADSLRLRDIVADRVNEVWVYYGVLDPTKNLSEDSNYAVIYVASNLADQSDNQNRDIRIKKVLSRWITDRAAAIELGSRYLERFALAPIEADFMLDAKDSNLKLCDFVTVESPQKQGFDGSPLAVLLQIVKRIEKQTGTSWAFTARQFAFSTQQFVNRVIYIDGSTTSELFDLNLKNAHDSRYDPSSLVAGSIVEFIITSGILISASTTSNYALTNPNTWPTGVFVKLTIESGASIVGRGGDGGRGGYAYTVWSEANEYTITYYDDGEDGEKGGSALHAQYPLLIENNGSIFVGGGGGGGSGGLITFSLAGFGSVSGCGGGGAWPLGSGGLWGRIDSTGTISADYVDYRGNDMYVGNSGQDASVSTFGVGGVSRSVGVFVTGEGGDGGDYDTGSQGSGGNSWSGAFQVYSGNPGNGGDAGDYAVNGNSYITWVATGTRYGAIV